MKNVLVIASLLLISACAPVGNPIVREVVVQPTPTPTPVTPSPIDEVQVAIDAIVKEENDYRLGLGQTTLTSGLSCSVKEVLSGQKILNASPAGGVLMTYGSTVYSYLYKSTFNQPNASSGVSNLVPAVMHPFFVGKNYYVTCSGQLVVLESNYYTFQTLSDDASLVYLDGSVLVNNDGAHGVATVTGTKYLRKGVHSYRVDYAQNGGGSFAMVLKANGALVQPKYYFH